jgi:hypothetical protein
MTDMKQKLFLSSAVVPALLVSGEMTQAASRKRPLTSTNKTKMQSMRKYLATFVGVVSALMGLTSVHAQSAFSNAITTLNPVAYWPLNETTAPPNPAPVVTNLGSLSSAFDGTYGGSVTYGVAGALAGTSDTAAGFDGVSGNMVTPYGSGISNSPSFTIEAWLLSHNVSATQCPLCNMDAASPRSGWLIYMDISNPGQYTIRTYNQNSTTPSLSMNIGGPGSIVQDQWYHLAVVVSNGVTVTNVYAYIDGVLVSGPTVLPAFVPDDGLNGGTFAIGERSDGGYFFDGAIDEVAYYTTALDGNTIAAHYSAGTNTSGNYSAQVLASVPALYFRFDQPASPVAHNYGSLGSAANGYYQTGTVPGVAGPSFGPFANGFDGSDFATQFSSNGTANASGSGPSVTCAPSNPSILNYTNSVTVSAWVKVPTGTNGWFEGILGRGDSSFRFAVDQSGLPHFADGGNADIVGLNSVRDGNWHYWVGAYNSANSNSTLYIDSVSAGTAVWNPIPGDSAEAFLIGGAPDYTGRNFAGEIAQVAIFTSALSVTNIQAVYNSTAPSPYQRAVVGLNPLAYWPLTETTQPPATPAFTGTNLGTVGSALDASFFADVVFGVPGALATTDTADGFNGATTGATTPYTADLANNPPFTIEAWLNSHAINATQCALCNMDAASAGRSGWLIYMDISNPGQYTFRAYADNGTTPSLALNIGAADSVQQDQWNHLVVVVSNAVGSNVVYGYLNGVQVAGPTVLPAYVPNDGLNYGTFAIGERSDAGYLFNGDIDEVAYYTNALDATTVLAHYQAGTNTGATAYRNLVLAQNPILYLRMDEAPAGTPYPGSLPVAVNYGTSGAAANGYYESGTTPGVAGPFGSNSLACLFTAGNGGPAGTAGPGVLCDPYNLTVLDATNGLTLAAWIQVPTTPNAAYETVLGRGDASYKFSVDATQFPRFFAAGSGNAEIIGNVTVNDGNWHLWVGTFNPVSGKADLYIDGIVVGSAGWSALTASEQFVFIGGAPDYVNDTINGDVARAFSGSISDVAVFTNAYTQAQIQQLYATIGVPPTPPVIVLQPPANDILLAGATLNASVLASGPGTLTYQWYFNTSNQIAGATSAALALANVQATNIGSYSCIVSNRYGTTNSTTLSLNVIAPTAYEAAAILADRPLAYWPLNETSGTTAYDIMGGNDGSYSNSPTLDVPGPSSYLPIGVGFDGASQFALVPDSATLDFSGQVTLEAWVQPGTQSDTLSDILAKGYDGNQNSSELQIRVQVTNFDGGYYNATVGGKGVAGGDTTTNWMHVALTFDGAFWNLYINGLSVGNFADTVGVENFSDPWGIADGTTSGNTRFYAGNICAVALYDHGLTPEKVQAHYNLGFFGTTNVPPTVVVPSAPITVDQGGSGSIPSTVVNGPAPFFYKWQYLVGATTNTIPGATNGTLALTNIQAIQGTYQYFVVVSNAYGATTSSFATLNILSGPPVLTADISPLLTEVPAGLPVSYFVTVTGTEPFSYQWSTDGGPILGATKSSYSFDALAGSNTYFVTVTNSSALTKSSTAVVIGVTNPPSVIGFNGTGSNWILNQLPGVTFLPFITNDVLELTDGNGSEASSAFYDIPQYIGGFTASFTYQVGPASSVADGATFCIQDNTNTAFEDTTNASVFGLGPSAVGGGGGALGYNGLTPSAAFEMNLYLSSPGGVGIEFATNGATGQTAGSPPYGATTPVNISSFDPILVQLVYSNNVLDVTLSDGKLVYKTNYFCDIPAVLGSSSAYIGFTGGDGSVASVQTVSGFQFIYTQPSPPAPVLGVAHGTPGSVVVSWPSSTSSSYVLQQASSLTGTWSNVGTAPVIVGSNYQVTLTPGTTTFYRLMSP